MDFILFDINIDGVWLKREVVKEMGSEMSLDVVPVLHKGTLKQLESVVEGGFDSTIGTAVSEGLILTPEVPMLDRMGRRIITKLKTKDFRK